MMAPDPRGRRPIGERPHQPHEWDRAEQAIDEALAQSFPASDVPPWTTGLDPQSVYVDEEDRRDRTVRTKESPPLPPVPR
jgi:hypothetical protein